MSRPRGRRGSTTTGSAGSTSASGSATIAGAAATGARRGDAGLAPRAGGAACARRAVTSRAMATYEAWVTSSTPTGTAASSSSQVPTWPSVLDRPLVSAQPTQPPVARIPPPCHALGDERVGRLLQQPRGGEHQHGDAGQRHPAAGAPRLHERREPPGRHQERAAGSPRSRGARNSAQPSQAPTGPTLVPCSVGMQRGIEDRQRDDREARDGHRDDAARLAEPSAVVARAARAARPRRRGPGGDRLVDVGGDGRGHQTSRIIGSTKGLRWKRWLTNWRTAVRTRAPIASRSHGSSGPRSASAASTAARSSSSRASLSLT